MNKKKIIALLLGCALLVGISPVFSLSDDGVTRVLACSDYQNPDGNEAGEKVVSSWKALTRWWPAATTTMS